MSFNDLPRVRPKKWSICRPGNRSLRGARAVAQYFRDKGDKVRIIKEVRWIVAIRLNRSKK